MTATTTSRALADAESRLGRPLTVGEQRIDLVRLDRAMQAAKDALEAEIRRERRRALRLYLASGRPIRIRRTPKMDKLLVGLYETGADAARGELRAAGYDPDQLPAMFAAVELPTTLEPLGLGLDSRLAALGRDAQARVLASDLSGLASSAIEAAFERLPGVRAIAADYVSTPLLRGMGDVWTQADDAGIVTSWTYSAIMDGGTCEPCGYLDGTSYPTWEEISYVLPQGGPHPECFGGMRCRCRAVPELADPTEPSGYPEEPPAIFPSAAGPTLADVVPGPSHEWRATVAGNQEERIRRYAELSGITADEWRATVDRWLSPVADAEVRVRVHPGALDAILSDGRFKSQFETGTSKGSLDPTSRAKVEGRMFGYPDDLPPEQRPIYGYMQGSYEEGGVDSYGEILVRLKDSVRTRTTFTMEDSLGPGTHGDILPAPVTSPSSVAYDWVRVPPPPTAEPSLRKLAGSYVEAQIHGGLAVDEIAEVVFPSWRPSNVWLIERDKHQVFLDALRSALTDPDADVAAVAEQIERVEAVIANIEAEWLTDPHAAAKVELDRLGIPWRILDRLSELDG